MRLAILSHVTASALPVPTAKLVVLLGIDQTDLAALGELAGELDRMKVARDLDYVLPDKGWRVCGAA